MRQRDYCLWKRRVGYKIRTIARGSYACRRIRLCLRGALLGGNVLKRTFGGSPFTRCGAGLLPNKRTKPSQVTATTLRKRLQEYSSGKKLSAVPIARSTTGHPGTAPLR